MLFNDEEVFKSGTRVSRERVQVSNSFRHNRVTFCAIKYELKGTVRRRRLSFTRMQLRDSWFALFSCISSRVKYPKVFSDCHEYHISNTFSRHTFLTIEIGGNSWSRREDVGVTITRILCLFDQHVLNSERSYISRKCFFVMVNHISKQTEARNKHRLIEEGDVVCRSGDQMQRKMINQF